MTSGSLIPNYAPELGDVIKYLQTSPIVKAQVPHVGTQLKVLATFDGGQKALLKPQWYYSIFTYLNVFIESNVCNIGTIDLQLLKEVCILEVIGNNI